MRLGELLVRAGLISAEQLEEALVEQRRVGQRLGSLLAESGLVSEIQVTQILSQQLSVPWVSLHHIDFSAQLLSLVPLDLVQQYCLIPIYVRRVRGLGDALYIAMDDPTNSQALGDVAERSRLHVRAMIAPPSDIRAAIRTYYGVGGDPKPARPAAPALDDAEEDAATGIHQRLDDDAEATGVHDRATFSPAPEPALPQPLPESLPELDRAVDLLIGGGPAPPAPTLPQPAPARTSSVPARASSVPAAIPPREAPARSSPISVPPPTPPPPVSSPRAAPLPSSPPAPRRDDSPPSARSSRDFSPAKPAGERARTSASKAGARRLMALTLLDGTTIQLPGSRGDVAVPDAASTTLEPVEPQTHDGGLTARDLVSALRAAAHGVDVSDTLGQNARWESLFAALLSSLLKKNLITDAEFLAEFKKS